MDERKEKAFAMFRQGKSGRYIAAVLGLNECTTTKWKGELMMAGWNPQEKKGYDLPDDFAVRWTVAVNRIRRYLGKLEFPMPEVTQ